MALLIINYLLLFLLFFITSKEFWLSIIKSYLLFFIITIAITETLSVFTSINFQGISYAWILILCVQLIYGTWLYVTGRVNIAKTLSICWKNDQSLSPIEILVIIFILVILTLTFLTAIISPPNNFDSMTYHMARVVHWIQNQSVRFYPTEITRQNYSMPAAEFLILHMQILSRSDRFANLVQWSAFVMLIVLVRNVSEYLGVSKRGRYLSVLFVASMPIAILESSSTQNDLLVAVFCVGFGFFLLKFLKTQSWKDLLMGGVAFGLALLTKGTAYIYCAGIGIPLAITGMLAKDKSQWISLLQKLIILVLLGLIINTPFYIRNLDLYGMPLSNETDRISVDRISIKGLYANLVRNTFVNFGVPVPTINLELTDLLREHLGVLTDDPEITFEGSSYKISYLINDDEAGNLLQSLLILPIIGFWFQWLKTKKYQGLAWSSTLFLSFILYSLLIKWQPWGTRLQLPLFALAAPLFGLMLDRVGKSTFISLVLVLSFSIYSLPYVFLNSTRPLVPLFDKSSPLRSNKVKRFFSDRPSLYQDYSEIIQPFFKDLSIFHTKRERLYFSSQTDFYEDYSEVSALLLALDEETVGLLTGPNDWEYPLWVLTDQHYGKKQTVFENVGVTNQTMKLSKPIESLPAYIIATRNSDLSSIAVIDYSFVYDSKVIDLLNISYP